MAIDEEINEYPELSCTYENQNMHKNYQSGCGCVPGQRSNKALSRSEVSAQLRNNRMYVREQDKEIMYDNQVNQSVNQSTSLICGALTKA